jgi:ATP-dependent Lon protease
MVTSIISAITEVPVNKDVAMTGEITLRGLVLPIGGLKEKLLAAHRAGITTVLIPIENKKDLVEVPKTILDSMKIIPVKNVDEVLKVALTKPLKRVEWVDLDNVKKTKDGKTEATSRH